MYDIRRLDEMTREAISHVYQSTYYLCCGGPAAEEASSKPTLVKVAEDVEAEYQFYLYLQVLYT